MSSRTRFTASEAREIRELLAAKGKAGRDEQKRLRGKLRKTYGFYITDFPVSGAFGPLDFDHLIRTHQISVDGSGGPVAPVPNSSAGSTPQVEPLRLRPAQARDPQQSRAVSDEAYVIDLCDEILGHSAQRQHRFPFLLGDSGHPLPVDAWYPKLNLVVEYRERQHAETVKFFDRRETVSGVPRGEQRRLYDQRRREVLPRHGITVVEVDVSELAHDRRRRLIRDRHQDRSALQQKLARFV